MNRMKSLVLGIIALAVAVGLLVTTGAAAKGKAPAELTIDIAGSFGDYFFTGTINSPKAECKNDRKITVYRRKSGKDEKIGSDRSSPPMRGGSARYWQVSVDEPDGEYYAKAGETNKCKKAKSPGIGVAPRAGGGKTNTKVLFGGANVITVPESAKYYGNIESSKRSCANKRKVTVYMKGSGPDEKIGSTKSEAGKGDSYFWEVVQDGFPMAGTYYAKAKGTDDCRGDRSKDFDFNR